MQNNRCPSCQSGDVLRVPVFFKVDNRPLYFAVFDQNKPIILHPRPQVCRQCGYVGMYLSEDELSSVKGIAT